MEEIFRCGPACPKLPKSQNPFCPNPTKFICVYILWLKPPVNIGDHSFLSFKLVKLYTKKMLCIERCIFYQFVLIFLDQNQQKSFWILTLILLQSTAKPYWADEFLVIYFFICRRYYIGIIKRKEWFYTRLCYLWLIKPKIVCQDL